MQAIQASWGGKTFALSRCSDSREKKPRNRRTKEERRTMAESFINKYRNLNSGKFPSLNLTHKEVGGSFYTVREIVREIIQENRVLGPGNSSSKAFNLEHCLEEHDGEPFSMDFTGGLSISTIHYAAVGRQEESYTLSEENIGKDESVNQKAVSSHPIDISVSQVMHDGAYHKYLSNGTCLHGDLVNLGCEKGNVEKLSGLTDNRIESQKQEHAEVISSEDPEICKFGQPIPLCQAVPITAALGEIVVNGDNTGNRSNNIARTVSSLAAGHPVPEIVGVDKLLETDFSLKSVTASVSDQAQLYSFNREDSPVASTVIETCKSDRSHETEGITCSPEALKPSNPVEGIESFEDSHKKEMEPTEFHSSCEIDEASAKSLSKLQNSESSASITTRSEHPVVQPHDLENVINDVESVTEDSFELGATRPMKLEVRDDHEHLAGAIGCASDSSSTPSSADSVTNASEINPVLAAIKGLLAAFIRFWTE